MFHEQYNRQGWPKPVYLVPDGGVLFKAVKRPDMFEEALSINPNLNTCLRHWDDSLQIYQGSTDSGWFDWEEAKRLSRHWFSTHIDNTFREKYAAFTHMVSWHNEIWANSQNGIEREERIKASEAAMHVWNTEFRHELFQQSGSDIRLVIGEAAVGNWMPYRIGQLCVLEDGVCGYHPYTHWSKYSGDYQRAANDWVDLSGLWDRMERSWELKPTWAFTEAGPFEGAITGWKASACLGANLERYKVAMAEWIEDVQQTMAYREGRILGYALFTSDAPNSGQFSSYNLSSDEQVVLAEQMAEIWYPGAAPPPPPPPADDELLFQQKAWRITASMQETGQGGIRLNSNAGIQRQITEDNFPTEGLDLQTVTDEVALEGRIIQAAESLSGVVPRRVYYWSQEDGVKYFEQPEGANFFIEDIVDQLTVHETKRYSTRPLTDITTLAIHHTAAPGTQLVDVIARYHVEHNDWPGIGYHYVISAHGEIFQTNRLESVSYHAGDNNQNTVGIALQGDFTQWMPPRIQLEAARFLVSELCAQFVELDILGHRELHGTQTTCPGNTFLHWLGYLKIDKEK